MADLHGLAYAEREGRGRQAVAFKKEAGMVIADIQEYLGTEKGGRLLFWPLPLSR